jgi:hypothetical protein
MMLWPVYLLCLAASLYCQDLLAGSPSASEAAEAADKLFYDGKKLRAQRMYSEACLKFEESYKLRPSGGTILHLAVCHVDEERLILAWVELHEALRFAQRDKRKDREYAAQQVIDMLASRYPRLSLRPSVTAAMSADVRIRVDGVNIPREHWTAGIPLESGDHAIIASADGFSEKRIPIQMNMASVEAIVEISEAGPTPSRTSTPTSAVSSASSASTPLPPAPISHAKPAMERALSRKIEPDMRPLPSSSTTSLVGKAVGLAVSGVGLVGIGIGAYFGSLAQEEANGNADLAHVGDSCARVSVGFFIAGGFTSLTGVAILLSVPSSQATRSNPAARPLQPSVRVSSQGLSIAGEF